MAKEQKDETAGPEPIAVIGMGCRFSGEASSLEGFWNMLQQGRTGHCKVPSARYEASGWHHPNHDRKGAVRYHPGHGNTREFEIITEHFLVRLTTKVGFSWKKILHASTLLSFRLPPKKQLAWIQSSGCSSKWHMRHLRMVCLTPRTLHERKQSRTNPLQVAYPWKIFLEAELQYFPDV